MDWMAVHAGSFHELLIWLTQWDGSVVLTRFRQTEALHLYFWSIAGLTRIPHQPAAAKADASALTALRSASLLNVLHEYDSGGLGRRPCQDGASIVSLRQLVRKAG